jgi:hypothetical protein
VEQDLVAEAAGSATNHLYAAATAVSMAAAQAVQAKNLTTPHHRRVTELKE